MTRIQRLLAVVATVAVALVQTAVAAPPNIVFVLADDLGSGELGCYGNTFNETPRLDAFARQAARFTQAYAMPVCSPTRASLMTGQYPVRTGINDYLDPKSPAFLDPARQYTVNRMLTDAGYHTGLIGKWHLDTHYGSLRGSPAQHGFDEVIATETKYIADGDYFFPYDKIATLKSGTDDEYLVDRQSEEAVQYIRRAKAGGKPFFLYLSHYAPHTALAAPKATVEKYVRKYEAKHGPGSAAKFDGKGRLGKPDNPYLAAMIDRIDTGFGRVLDTLAEEKIDDNTVVIFLSDNGGDGRVANNGTLRAAKANVYEGGIRVPQLVRWPGVTRGGSDVAEPTLTIDYYATFADIAGVAVPTRQAVDGVSFAPLLRGQPARPRDALYWHHAADAAPNPRRAADAVRVGDWKLIEFRFDSRVELYDLKADPSEQADLAAARPEQTQALLAKLRAWQAENGITPLKK